MMKYKCIRTCIGYRKRYWNVGDIVEVNDTDATPPEHFVPVEQITFSPIVVNDPMKPVEMTSATTYSEMNESRAAIKTGMAVGLEESKEVIVARRGRPKKK